ncbi:Jacalin-like lectin domain-containing protein [Nemania abortiva]|nr:Jacalin-like lectin domain-containing protein [Nemania abortiva]
MDSVGGSHDVRVMKSFVNNQTTGGSSGTAFTLTNQSHPVTSISVWIARGKTHSDRDLVKAIKVTWSDGKDLTKGNKTGNEYSFDFNDNEKVKSLAIWTGDRVDKIKLTTDGDRTFEKGGWGGSSHSQDVGNGVLLGFTGTANSDELVSLGAKFKEDSD